MKTFFKIISLLLVVAAVAVAIIFTQESVNEYRAYKTIMPFDFKKYVTDKVDNDIKGSDASKVRPSYVSIYDIITTESSIESNSDSLVSDDVITQCYEHAFMAYWKILDEELDSYLFSKRQNWEYPDSISQELAYMKKQRGCTTDAKDKISEYEGYMTGYNNALKIIADAKNCKNGKTYDRIRRDYGQYMDSPYSNNGNLQDSLKNVEKNARNSWKKSLLNSMNYYTKTNKFMNDDDMQNFIKSYNNMMKGAESYEYKFGEDTDIKKAKDELIDKSFYWDKFFKDKKNKTNGVNYRYEYDK